MPTRQASALLPTDRLIPVYIADVSGAPKAAWALGMRVLLPHSFLQAAGLSQDLDAAGRLRIRSPVQDTLADAAHLLRCHAAFTERPPASAQLRISYRLVPA